MTHGSGIRRLLALLAMATIVVACGAPEAVPSARVDATGILLVAVGEPVQARPPNEALAQAFSDAVVMTETNGDDLGYPWIDPATGQLVLSAVTPRGRTLIDGAGISVPHRVRDVARSAAELRRIQEAVTQLRSQGVPGADLIAAAGPDHRDNRTLIVIRAMSQPLLEALAQRYPVDAIAVQVNAQGL